MRRIPPFALLLTLLISPAGAQSDWFPQEFEEGAARQLIVRLMEIGVEIPKTDRDPVEGARNLIRDLVSRIDARGLEGTIDLAPELAQIDLPEFADRIVATIASYGSCALPLHPELVETNDEKMTVALGEMAVVIVSAFLRHQFLAAGGTDEQLAAQLNSDRMNQLSYDVQVNEEQRNYVVAECGPMFEALFGE